MRVPPKKRFGQHFLRDTGILQRIERLMKPSGRDAVVEIGAGDGALSILLAPKVSRLAAVEVDSDRIPDLQARLGSYPNVEVVHADILQLDLDQLVSELGHGTAPVRLAGNLPYNIATAIIHRALRCRQPISDMLFMVQLEVAQRIIAAPGTKAYGYLSVDCQYRASASMVFKVPPECFSPRPRVTSAVVALQPRGIEAGTPLDETFDTLVKAAFAHRRKTIGNSLRQHAALGPIAANLLSSAGDLGSRRAEEISVGEYLCLAHSCCRLYPDRSGSHAG